MSKTALNRRMSSSSGPMSLDSVPPPDGSRRVFLAGATGVIGLRVLRLLVGSGYAVAGMTRSPAKVEQLRSLGAEPVVCDAFDGARLRDAVAAFAPDAVMHQLTDLPDDPAHIPALAGANARMRREGTRNLLVAARAAGARRFIAQSVAWEIPGDGGVAIEEHERAVLSVGGTVIRYGQFYGEGTYFEDKTPPPPCVHVDDAAQATLAAMTAASGEVIVVSGGGR